jgi:hypothetical protein
LLALPLLTERRQSDDPAPQIEVIRDPACLTLAGESQLEQTVL